MLIRRCSACSPLFHRVHGKACEMGSRGGSQPTNGGCCFQRGMYVAVKGQRLPKVLPQNNRRKMSPVNDHSEWRREGFIRETTRCGRLTERAGNITTAIVFSLIPTNNVFTFYVLYKMTESKRFHSSQVRKDNKLYVTRC